MLVSGEVANEPKRYFDIEGDKTLPFFCQACVVGKTEAQMSKRDTRYCSECQVSIEADYKLCGRKYIPQPPDANLAPNNTQPIQTHTEKVKGVLLRTKNRDTHAYQNPTEDRPKPNVGGRPKKDIPVQLICKFSQEGLAIKPIVRELKRQGYTISPMTVSRVLSGERIG